MSIRRLAAGALGMVCVVMAVAGCGSSGSSGSSGGYNWGIDAELSGPASAYGTTIQTGVQAYVDQVNAAGGINGHKITLTALDNAGDQSRSAANATQLATASHVNAIFGQALSADCTAAQTAVDRYKVPMACLSVNAPDPYVFSLGPDNSRVAQALVAAGQKVVNRPNLNAAFVYLNTLTDVTLSKTIPAVARQAGVTISTSQEISLTATDVSSQVAAIVAAKPDVVLISETGPGLLSVLRGVRAAGINAPFVWVDGTGNLGALAQSTDPGVYAMTVYQIVEPGGSGAAADYISAITPKLQGAPSVATLNNGETLPGYMTARAFGEALKTCGYPCSGADLKTNLEKLTSSQPGLVTSFSYSPQDHYPYANWYVYHLVGTQPTLVDTLPAGSAAG